MKTKLEAGGMVQYQFSIDTDAWERWKETVPRTKTLEERIVELIEADTEGRVTERSEEPPTSREDTDTTEKRFEQEDVSEVVDEGAEIEKPKLPREQRSEAKDILLGLDLPGSGSKFEARVHAMLALYDYLRERQNELVAKDELEDYVQENGVDVGYSSFDSYWANWVKANKSQGRYQNTLAQLPGVTIDGDDYVYSGGRND